MKKLLLCVIAVACVAMLVPQTRARILTAIGPLDEYNRRHTARRALKGIAVDVQREQARTRAYPRPDGFARWLEESGESPVDPWGSAYYLEIFPDSFVVGSLGPDSRWRSEDDIRVLTRREPTAAGLGSAYQPPAPPSSGVKSSGVRKAQEAAKRDP